MSLGTITDMQLAKNLGCKGFIDNNPALGAEEVSDKDLDNAIFQKRSWEFIYHHLLMRDRAVSFEERQVRLWSILK